MPLCSHECLLTIPRPDCCRLSVCPSDSPFNLPCLMLHSLAIHHSLPRMIKEDVDDPADWVLEHLHLPTPGESSLGPLVTFSRMCRLYADSLGAMCGDSSDMRMLGWIELEWKRWRKRWLEDNGILRSELLQLVES